MSVVNPFHHFGNPYKCNQCWERDSCRNCQINLVRDTWESLYYYLPNDRRVVWKMSDFDKKGADYFEMAQRLFNDYKIIIKDSNISSVVYRLLYMEMRKLSMFICHYAISFLEADDKKCMNEVNSAIKMFETTYYWAQVINKKWSDIM